MKCKFNLGDLVKHTGIKDWEFRVNFIGLIGDTVNYSESGECDYVPEDELELVEAADGTH